MDDAFNHPDPDHVPSVAWGASIPLSWERASDGCWRVWPPKRFRLLDDGSEWMLGAQHSLPSFYTPIELPLHSQHRRPVSHEFGHRSPIVQWGGQFPANWSRHDDGRLWVQLGTLRAHCGPSLIYFREFTEGDLFFYPCYGADVTLNPPETGSAEYMGYLFGDPTNARHWRTPTLDGRWLLGQLTINPPQTRFDAYDQLIPLELPTEDEIEADRQFYLGLSNRQALDRGDIHYLTMAVDLSRNLELMACVGQDAFSAQVQRFMATHHLVRKRDGARVFFGSDRNYGVILALLRRYGESYMMYDNNWAYADPEVQLQVERMFADADYVIASEAGPSCAA